MHTGNGLIYIGFGTETLCQANINFYIFEKNPFPFLFTVQYTVQDFNDKYDLLIKTKGVTVPLMM